MEALNGHPLRSDEILNIDETGFDLTNCVKPMRVIIRYDYITAYGSKHKVSVSNVIELEMKCVVGLQSLKGIQSHIIKAQQTEHISQQQYA